MNRLNRTPHPLPVCRALLLLGFSGYGITRQLRVHETAWEQWRKGATPREVTRSGLILLARRTLEAARSLAPRQPLLSQETLATAEVLVQEQESIWRTFSPVSLLRAEHHLSE